jgi:hypothetical protein
VVFYINIMNFNSYLNNLPPLNHATHNCRPEKLKIKLHNPIHEASVLSKGLNRTKNSYFVLHEKYIIDNYKSHHELIEELDKNLQK